MKFIKYLIQLIYNFFIFKKENKVEIINYNTYLIKDFDIKLFQEINNYRKLNNIPFLEGNVIKYVTRWRNKNGIADLEKAKHYIELLIELESK